MMNQVQEKMTFWSANVSWLVS